MSHKPEAAVTGRRGLARQAVGNMAWVAWGSATVSLLRVLVLVILTRLLAPADFGLVSAALVVISFSLNFAQLGLGPALVQRPDLQPRHVSTAFYASIVFGVLVAAIVVADRLALGAADRPVLPDGASDARRAGAGAGVPDQRARDGA